MLLWVIGLLTLGALLREPRKTYAAFKGAYLPGSHRGQAWAAYAARKYGQAFVDKSGHIAAKHGVSLGELLSMFHHESHISSSIVNWLGCVGLIQFCPDAWVRGKLRKRGCSFVGKTAGQLKAMSPLEQLDYVDLYFSKWEKIKKPRPGHVAEDLNLLIFHPAHMGRPDKYSGEDKTYLAGYYRSLKAGLLPKNIGQ